MPTTDWSDTIRNTAHWTPNAALEAARIAYNVHVLYNTHILYNGISLSLLRPQTVDWTDAPAKPATDWT